MLGLTGYMAKVGIAAGLVFFSSGCILFVLTKAKHGNSPRKELLYSGFTLIVISVAVYFWWAYA